MLTKLVTCLLLVISVTQATLETGDSDGQIICDAKIQWYRDVTNNIKKIYDEYRKTLTDAKLPSDAIEKFSVNQALLEKQIYDSESKNLTNDGRFKNRFFYCDHTIDRFIRESQANLARTAINLKTDVLNAVDQSGISKIVSDSLKKSISGLINLPYIAIYRGPSTNVSEIVEKCALFTENGVELEKEWNMNSIDEVEILDVWAINYDDNSRGMIEQSRIDRARHEELVKGMEELEKPIYIQKNKNDDDDDDDGGPFGAIQKLTSNYPTATITVSTVIILVGILAGVIWIVHQARTGRYSTFS